MATYWSVYKALDFWKGKKWALSRLSFFFGMPGMTCWMISYSNARKPKAYKMQKNVVCYHGYH